MSERANQETAVCNTGPLIALAKIGQLGLLPRLFAQVMVPAGVIGELSAATRLPEADIILATKGIERVTLDRAPDPLLLSELGSGEAEVIALAVARGIERVIIDERKGRRIASLVYGLKVIGTGGVLLKGKRVHLLKAVRPLMEQMRANGYYLSDRLVEQVARECGE
jgi:predicted nucleic acid-binding protein